MKKLLYILFLISFSTQAQNILFVGNSLTYSNEMPDILEYIGKKNGVSIQTASLCFPNYAIIDHINRGLFQQQLAKKQYDYLIIQQGPSSQPEGKRMLLEDGAKVKTICDTYNTKLGYYMVWPSVRYYFTINKVIENHAIAAKQNNALLFPVGRIWKEYNTNKKLESLYSFDEFHPSKTGSFLAALTIFHRLHPEIDLQKLRYKKYKKWVTNETSFKQLVLLVEQYGNKN